MIAPVYSMGCANLAWHGGWDEARRANQRYLDWAREQGRLHSASIALSFMSTASRVSGRLAEAEAEARSALEIATGVVSFPHYALTARTNLLAALIARGDLEEANRLASKVDLSAGIRMALSAPVPLEVRGYLRLAEGDLEGGVEDLLTLGEELEELGALNPAFFPWRQEAVPALAALDRSAEAKELIEVGEERARRIGAPHITGPVLRSRAMLEPRKRQIETLRESVAALETYGPPHELARSLVELGAAMRRDGQRSESREPLRRALELAHTSGAGGIEARAREELSAAGSRPRSAFRTGVAALTPSELRTARMAAEGLTNTEIAQRLFVSRKTVEKHLGNAYMKLDIAGREELAAALAVPPTS
jgi:DNA-binding CsgD family transcriptional regulator